VDTIIVANKTKQQLIDEVVGLRQRIIQLEAIEEKRERVEIQLRARALQQAVVAELGQRVLAGIELADLLDETTVLVAETLNVEFCHVLELMPDRDVLLLRAGVGWQEGLVGHASIDAQPDSHMGYTLFSSEPVIVEDLYSDPRFHPSPLLHEHGVVSGMSVIIDGEKWPFGVLSIHTGDRRTFTRTDINILQAVANVLATAIEHKRTQQALRKAHDQLEKRVRERTNDLKTANEELRTFAYTVSHDLRAPLVNIKGFVGELRLAIKDVQPIIEANLTDFNMEQQQVMITALEQDLPEAMTFIDSSVTHMDRLVNAILQLSRLGRRELAFEPIEMTDLVQSILKTLAHRIEQQQVEVTIGTLPGLVADQTSMEQIFGNLLTNAVIYLDPDRRGQIWIEGKRNHHETIYCIRDNGRGITVENLPKIFELFRRADNHDVPGEGMGLAYVRTLVRRHGGRIWCESEPNVGTRFTFTVSNRLTQGEKYA
jgi:signal transduction histidine kinase